MERRAKSSLSTGREAAEEIGLAALTYLAQNSEHLDRFFAITGLGIHNLRAAARRPGFYAAVLDYFMADERSLLAFAQSANLPPDAVVRAREALGDPRPPVEP
jgi:hypothetical protein